MSHRASMGDLGFYDDEPVRPQRWDRERFERYRSRGPEGREPVRFDERGSSSSGSGRPRRNTEVDIDERDRRGRTHIEVLDREYDREKPSRRRPEFLDREEPTPSEVANLALAPFRRQSVASREHDGPVRRPTRPQYIRRQSSLDTYDRRPLPRYAEREREDWRPPTNVPIPLPIRERRSQKPSFREEEFDERSYRRDSRPEYEDYRDIEIRRERSTRRRRSSKHSKRSKRAPSVSSSSSSSSESHRAPSVHSSFHDVSVHSVHEPPPKSLPPPSLPGKKGKTRMPKRLVHKNALVEKGYEFDEEEDFLIVRRALEKEQIDEVIHISEKFKESRVTYRYDDPGPDSGPIDFPPPPPESVASPPSLHSHHTHHTHHSRHTSGPPPPPSHVAPAPPPPEAFAPPPPPPPASMHHSHGPNIREVAPTQFSERFEESAHVNGPLTSLVPHRPRGEREVREEIRSLEEERRMVRYDRETDYEVVEHRPRDVVRVEKDRKAKRPNDVLLAAMVATLT